MNVLDENIREDQRRRLQSWRIAVHQIGRDIGRKGMKDNEIIPFLHQLGDPTFFTRDDDFYDHQLCHARYCITCRDVPKSEAATFACRLLHHQGLDTKAKRMGTVIRVTHTGLFIWRLNAPHEIRISW